MTRAVLILLTYTAEWRQMIGRGEKINSPVADTHAHAAHRTVM